jgi:hypothetical protein
MRYRYRNGSCTEAGLQLVATPEPPPLPRVDSLVRPAPRRPGDRHELVDLPDEVAEGLEREAASKGLSLDVATALHVESSWLLAQLGALSERQAVEHLDRVAEAGRVTRRLTAAEADYLRLLCASRCRPAFRSGPRVALPIRLLGRLGPELSLFPHGDRWLARAVRWEIAAVLARLTMTEWAFRATLSRGRDPGGGAS